MLSWLSRNWSSRRLNNLAEINAAKSYLEIGVYTGMTFRRVNVEKKVAVDPDFQFEIPQDDHEYHECPSDEYFAKADGTFDLIFIDGLHHFEQTLRDFDNSVRHSHDKTIWMIDDVYPNDAFSILEDQEECYRLRSEAGKGRNLSWHGDIFKVAFAIHDLRPEFSFATAKSRNPQMIIWRSPRTPEKRFENIVQIDNLNYEDFLANRDLLNLMSERDAIQKAKQRN